MNKPATQHQERQGETEGVNIPRNDDLDELTRLSRERRDQQIEKDGFEPTDTSTPAVLVEDDDGADETPAAKQEAAEPVVTDDDSDTEMVTIVVDGQERRVPLEEVLAAGKKSMQIDEAAESRLEKANRILKQAQEAQHRAPEATPASEQVSPQGEPQDFDAAELARAIQYGSEEEAAAAVQRLAIGRQQATRIASMPQEQMLPLIQDTMAYNSAVEMLERPAEDGGYGDLWGDPIMRNIFIQKEQEMRAMSAQTGESLPGYRQLYSSIGDEIRKWRDTMVSPGAASTVSMADKKQRKKQTDVAPVAGGRSPATGRAESKPKSRGEVLAEMAKGRHQDY